ncbi:MAG: phosphopyruvate hydratase [Candidatus Micrarchaeia archaeon]|jgi:enolase
MPKIKKLFAREILDSRGNPTIEVDLYIGTKISRAAAPSGASTGIHEALELRDNDIKRFKGKGVLKAVENVNTKINNLLKGEEISIHNKLDRKMIKLDNMQNKSNLGANATTAVSMAMLKAAAKAERKEVYEYLGGTILPIPMMNIINGGQHGGNSLAIQEFMILPIMASSFKEAIQWGSEVYHNLGKYLEVNYGKNSKNVGDEGGYAPNFKTSEEALNAITYAIKESGYEGKVFIGLDAAASSFYNKHTNRYFIDGKNLESYELVDYYENLVAKYPIISIEDPFDEEDFNSFSILNKRIGEDVQIIGDDLTVTNIQRIEKAISQNSMNTLLLKVNQVGTIAESFEAVKVCYQRGLNVVVSHRSGETEDTLIADLAVGLETGQIKTGAPARTERTAKYNRLLRIEEKLGKNAVYAGVNFKTLKRKKNLRFYKLI